MNNLLIALRGSKSRKEVALALGITPQGLGAIERGERNPRPALMKKFANFYGKTVQELFFDEERHVMYQQAKEAV